MEIKVKYRKTKQSRMWIFIVAFPNLCPALSVRLKGTGQEKEEWEYSVAAIFSLSRKLFLRFYCLQVEQNDGRLF